MITSARASDEARVLIAGLGLVGVIAEVELQLGPGARARVRSRTDLADDNLFEEIKALLKVRPRRRLSDALLLLLFVSSWRSTPFARTLHKKAPTNTTTTQPQNTHTTTDDAQPRRHVVARPRPLLGAHDGGDGRAVDGRLHGRAAVALAA